MSLASALSRAADAVWRGSIEGVAKVGGPLERGLTVAERKGAASMDEWAAWREGRRPDLERVDVGEHGEVAVGGQRYVLPDDYVLSFGETTRQIGPDGRVRSVTPNDAPAIAAAPGSGRVEFAIGERPTSIWAGAPEGEEFVAGAMRMQTGRGSFVGDLVEHVSPNRRFFDLGDTDEGRPILHPVAGPITSPTVDIRDAKIFRRDQYSFADDGYVGEPVDPEQFFGLDNRRQLFSRNKQRIKQFIDASSPDEFLVADTLEQGGQLATDPYLTQTGVVETGVGVATVGGGVAAYDQLTGDERPPVPGEF